MIGYRWNKNSLFSRAEQSRAAAANRKRNEMGAIPSTAIRFILPEVNSRQLIEIVTVRAVVSRAREAEAATSWATRPAHGPNVCI